MRLIAALILAMFAGGIALYENDPDFRRAVDGTAEKAERGDFNDRPQINNHDMETQAAPRPNVDRYRHRGGAESRVEPRSRQW